MMSNAHAHFGPYGPYKPPPGDDDAAWFDYAARLRGGFGGIAPDFPDFMLIGGGRSGTSWMYTTLAKHPNVYVGPHQEIHHFTSDWHRNPIAVYCGYYAGHRHQARGDFTPVTALLPRPAIRAIHSLNPKLKVLYAVRNPMDHAWAMARHMINHRAYSFVEIERTGQITLSMLVKFLVCDYAIASSDHAAVLARWLEVFPREQMLVYFNDDTAGPSQGSVVARVQDFLAIPPHDPAQLIPPGRVKEGLDAPLPDFLKPLVATIWRPRMRHLAKLLEERFGLAVPAAWASDLAIRGLDESVPLFDGIVLDGDGMFVAEDGAHGDYLLDLHLARSAAGAPWDISDWRQARIVREMNAELFARPVAKGWG